MSALIYGKAIQPAVVDLVKHGKPAYVAAPYWGSHANNALGLGKRKLDGKLQVICDIFATTTDPGVIRDLINRDAEVRINRQLHAKVYLNQNEAIIGSANVSGKAFGLGDDVQHEMCTRLSDSTSLADLNSWWATRWKESTPMPKGKALTERILRHSAYARELEAAATDLLEALKRAPDKFNEVFVRVDWIPLAKKVVKRVEKMGKEFPGLELGAWTEWTDMPANAEVISYFSDGPHLAPYFDGVLLTPDDPAAELAADPDQAVIVTALNKVKGYSIGNKPELIKAVKRYKADLLRDPANEGGFLLLRDFAVKYLGFKL